MKTLRQFKKNENFKYIYSQHMLENAAVVILPIGVVQTFKDELTRNEIID